MCLLSKLGTFQSLFLWVPFQSSVSFFTLILEFWWYQIKLFCCCPTYPWLLFSVYLLSDWVNVIDLSQAHWTYPRSSPLYHWAHPPSFKKIVNIFPFYHFNFVIFYKLHVFAPIVYFFTIYLEWTLNCCWSIFPVITWKVLSDNGSIWLLLVVASVSCRLFFLIQAEISWVSLCQATFKCNLNILIRYKISDLI